MSAATWVAALFGAALICTALLDVFITVLHTQVESPISNGLARGFWRLLTWATKGLTDEARGAVLAWGAPYDTICSPARRTLPWLSRGRPSM